MHLFPSVQRNSPKSVKIHVEDKEALNKFAIAFSQQIRKNLSPERPRIIVCIGTDRSTGDSLGPLVGSNLLETNHTFFKVMGTLESPVHATNLATYMSIVDKFENPFVVAIDACLGSIDNVGYINIGEGALKPGAGVNKHLPPVGHIHITGIVNVGGFMEYFVLQNTRLNIVMKMAKIISQGIHESSIRFDMDQYCIKTID
ncbi:spore protease YyaC [Phosphitispora sp. TUW77]|uniref:spore protease YyaC n=1 Tax=Phosphitispora sp. TUW77 TaxID=3152361 RepID=UPI003AB23F21